MEPLARTRADEMKAGQWKFAKPTSEPGDGPCYLKGCNTIEPFGLVG